MEFYMALVRENKVREGKNFTKGKWWEIILDRGSNDRKF